ncbi:MAG: hypothetical protein IKZ53_07400 [Selenomonadaceae bacterium]|nr:hypothetical protein [Selenomonadaceae bacterium]
MTDKQMFTLMKAVTDIVNQDKREILMLINGFGEKGDNTNVVASLNKNIDAKNLAQKFIMLMQSSANLSGIDFDKLLAQINEEAFQRGLVKKEG